MTMYNFYRNMCTKSLVREIATIEATSIHQRMKNKNLTKSITAIGKRVQSIYKRMSASLCTFLRLMRITPGRIAQDTGLGLVVVQVSVRPQVLLDQCVFVGMYVKYIFVD